MRLGYPAFIGPLIVSMLSSATFCTGQSQTQSQSQSQGAPPIATSNPGQPAQPPATIPPMQDRPGAQPSPIAIAQDPASPVQQDGGKKKDDRMFFVMPNYLTVDSESQVNPISWKEKFSMAAKGSFDPYEFTVVGIVAGIRQAENSSPGFGQGAEGYAKRYGAAFADQVDGNVMVGGLFPTILKLDPRYFQLGRGSFPHRFGYAISRIFVARKDSGGSMFNIPEFAGNATAIAISNVYYPASDRSASSSLSDWGTQMGLDAFGNELKEFWPDIHRYLQRRHQRRLEKEQEKQNN